MLNLLHEWHGCQQHFVRHAAKKRLVEKRIWRRVRACISCRMLHDGIAASVLLDKKYVGCVRLRTHR